FVALERSRNAVSRSEQKLTASSAMFGDVEELSLCESENFGNGGDEGSCPSRVIDARRWREGRRSSFRLGWAEIASNFDRLQLYRLSPDHGRSRPYCGDAILSGATEDSR